MPTFYHIHRTIDQSDLDNGFVTGDQLFYSKKDSFWHTVERNVSKDPEFGGYREYEIFIPSTAYTTSMNPRTPKILKVTSDNVKEYKKFITKKDHHYKNKYDPMVALGFIGVDFTDLNWRHNGLMLTQEGVIWAMPDGARIKLINVVKY